MASLGQASVTKGDIEITVDGEKKTVYIVAQEESMNPTVENNAVTLNHNDRLFFAERSSEVHDPEMYYKVDLLNKKISYTADISQSTCSCNAAVYTVQMPGKFANGTYNPGHYGDYYCDANNVGGVWCPEFDLSEANIHAM
jgi:hypothetical protein